MEGEKLNQPVMKVWSDHQNTVVMVRTFAGHLQIISAILRYNGDNNYLSDRGGMGFGIRHTFVRDEGGRSSSDHSCTAAD